MKFLRLEVENWRPFRGRSTMNIAATQDQPITLIFGKNGGGKTSLLNAIYWCLYGRMDLEEGKGTQHIVNDHAVQEGNATKSNPVNASVTLFASQTKEENEYLYRIQRKQKAYDLNGVRREDPDGVSVERIRPHRGYTYLEDVSSAFDHPDSLSEKFEGQQAKSVIEELLPHNLARFFFYPGETLSFPFKYDKRSRGRLEGFLREISGGSKFEPFDNLIGLVSKNLAAKSDAFAAADVETKKLQKDLDELKDELERRSAQLPKLHSQLEAAVLIYNSVSTQLQEFEELREFVEDANAARRNEETAEAEIDHANERLADALGSAYLHVATPLFDSVCDIFDSQRYPNDVSSTLIAQMRDQMKCICGRTLTDDMLEMLEPLSPTDDSVGKRMITLNDYATSLRTSTEATDAVDTARVELDEAIQSHKATVEARGAAESRLKEAGADSFKEVDKDNLINQRSAAQNDMDELRGKIAVIEGGIGRIKEEIDKKEEEKRTAAPKEHQNVHEAAQIAREMSALLDDIRRQQADVAREQLERLINSNYVLYKNNIRIEIDSAFAVRVHDETNDKAFEKPIGDLSGSETALLTYAFAAAAAKLLPQYQSLDKLLTTIPVFEDVENIPLVVDAPFTNLGSEYKQRVMDLITIGFSQVLAFSEASTAEIEVLENASEKVGRQYLVHFQGQLAEDAVCEFEWKGKRHVYASVNKDLACSTLESIG